MNTTTTKFFSRVFLWLILFIFFSFSTVVSLVTDWWWFSEVGFTEVFIRSLVAKLLVGVTVTLFSATFLLINFFIFNHPRVSWFLTIPEILTGDPLTINDRLAKKIGIVSCLALSLFTGFIAATRWLDVLKFFAASPFGHTDPLFGRDVAFYVFFLPVYSLGLNIIKTLVLFSLILGSIIYFARGDLSFSKKFKIFTEKKARIHLGFLLSLLFLIIALNTYLSVYDLLNKEGELIQGAAFTEVNVTIPLMRVSVFVYIIASLLALYYGLSGKFFPLIGVFFLAVALKIIIITIPPLFHKIIVAPNELSRESPFLKYHIDATRKAYSLDQIEEKEILADKPLTSSDILSNNLTIKNVRLWDREPLLSTFSQIQEIRTYYEFVSVDNDRYIIDGELRQIMLSPREISYESLPNKTWINERLIFTHGYGVTAGPVNQVTPEGLPVLFVKDLPPQTEIKELSIERPEIYFGELVNNYVLTKTKLKEFDYPKGEENVYGTYSGTGGVEINSFLKRLFYALRFGSLKILLSGDITPQSRILYYRNIKERTSKIAPFLTYDRDPYMVIADKKLYWIIDAYTITDRYPYSKSTQLNNAKLNYIRNSVKVIVDAYNGTISFYQVDKSDPIIKSYTKIFPKTLKSFSDIPKSLMFHLRYPEDIFYIQASVYTTYHMDDSQIFYNKEDLWEIPAITQEKENQGENKTPRMAPRHMIMKLPGEKKEEYILMLPFTPKAKDNLSAWMIVRNDGDFYGKMIIYRFPKDKLVFGPRQVIARINQDAEISRQITLWDQRGSQVIQGPLLVIPIEESLIYVRPLYLKANDGKIPELKRVIVVYENKIAMEGTLEEALAKIFGTNTQEIKKTKPIVSDDRENLLKQANEAYEAAISAQKEGNWARYGDEIKKVGDILKKLKP